MWPTPGPGHAVYGSGGGPFDPLSIAGCKVWLKADALALSDGAGVSTWPDSSGSGNNFGGDGIYQIFKTNIVNGKPVVRFFAGGGSGTQCSGVSIAPVQFTIFMVAAVGNVSAQGVFYNTGQNGASSFYFLNNSGTLYQGFFTAPGTPVTVTEPGGLAVGVWNVLTTDWNGANIHLWRNGTLKGTTGAATRANTGIVNAIGIGATEGFGLYAGDIAEFLLYDSALSATDRPYVENGLKSKYAIP